MTPIPDETSKVRTVIDDSRQARNVRWTSSDLKCAYANVCNVTSTREEVVLNFGITSVANRNHGDVEVQLTSRVILSPYAAKRLRGTLDRLINEYESRYGQLSFD